MPLPAACSGDRTNPILQKMKPRFTLTITAPAVDFRHAHRSVDEADFSPYGHRLRATGLAGHTRPRG